VNGGVDDKPRMTAADADARFAALVAEHRAGRKTRGARTAAGPPSDRFAGWGLALVYALGVVAGAIFHAKPLLAIVLGAPTIFIARVLYRRSRDRSDAP